MSPVPSVRMLNSQVSDALQHIVEKSLAKNPALRYQNAGEMARDLENFVAWRTDSHCAAPRDTKPDCPQDKCDFNFSGNCVLHRSKCGHLSQTQIELITQSA